MAKHSLAALEQTIEAAFEARDTINIDTKGEVREAVNAALDLLDKGEARVASKGADGNWIVHQWLKKAVLLSFRLNDMEVIKNGNGNSTWWDKVPSKFEGWGEKEFRAAGFRAVPGSIVRQAAYIAKNVFGGGEAGACVVGGDGCVVDGGDGDGDGGWL